MSQQSLGFCSECGERVPAEYRFKDGRVWFRKACPDCGTSESLISSDATAWQAKRSSLGRCSQEKFCGLRVELR